MREQDVEFLASLSWLCANALPDGEWLNSDSLDSISSSSDDAFGGSLSGSYGSGFGRDL